METEKLSLIFLVAPSCAYAVVCGALTLRVKAPWFQLHWIVHRLGKLGGKRRKWDAFLSHEVDATMWFQASRAQPALYISQEKLSLIFLVAPSCAYAVVCGALTLRVKAPWFQLHWIVHRLGKLGGKRRKWDIYTWYVTNWSSRLVRKKQTCSLTFQNPPIMELSVSGTTYNWAEG